MFLSCCMTVAGLLVLLFLIMLVVKPFLYNSSGEGLFTDLYFKLCAEF